jgi:uncharacterized protein involved in outer membrane biogenesis
MRKIILRILFFLLIAAALISLSIILIGYLKGDDFKNRLVEGLNRQLLIEVSVEKIDFSVFDNFPNASVTFTNVSTKERGVADNHPLIKAEKVSMLFNVLDLLKKNYKIENIEINNAFISIYERSNGSNNYRILNKKLDEDNAQYALNLQKVNFKNVQVSYINESAEQEYLFRVDDGVFTGMFSQQQYRMGVKGDFYSYYYKTGHTTLLEERAVMLTVQMDVNNDQKLFTIRKGAIYLQGMAFDLDGSVSYKNENSKLALNIGTKNISIPSLMGLIPSEYLTPIQEYKIEGKADFNAQIHGPFASTKLPELNFTFELYDTKIEHLDNHQSLKSISLTGTFINGKLKNKESFELHLENINAQMRSANLKGEISIINFNQPELKTSIRSGFRINDFISSELSEKMKVREGDAEIDISFRNKLKSFRKFTIEDFLSSQTSGTLKIDNLYFKVENSPLSFNDFSGDFNFSNANLIVNHFSGKVSESDFQMTGDFINVLPFLFNENEKLRIIANFHSEQMDLTELLQYKTTSSDTLYQLNFSERIIFDLNTKIKNLSFKKFNASNISGKIRMNNQKLVVDGVAFDAMQGDAIINGQIKEINGQGFEMRCNAEVKNVSIEDLFYELGNFGQQNITSENLKGKLTTSISYSSSLSRDLKIDPDGVYVLADVEVLDGELVNYKPMLKLSKFIKEDELKHIRFSKLQNSIEIKNRVIYIPEMEIESSAINISLNGTHTFDNDIDYHAWIELSELRPDKKQNLEEIEGIIIEDDGLGKTSIPIKMTGNADAPDIRFDVKAGRNKLSSELKEERESLKDALKKEFGRKDRKEDEQQLNPNQGNKTDFIIDWDEAKKDSTLAPTIIQKKKNEKKPAKNQQKDFIIEWDEEEEGDTL